MRNTCQAVPTLQAWRQHTADLRAVRAAITDRHSAEAGVTQRLALRAWRGHTAQRRAHRTHVLEVCVTKQVAGLQGNAFAAWLHYTQVRSGGGRHRRCLWPPAPLFRLCDPLAVHSFCFVWALLLVQQLQLADSASGSSP